MSARRLRRGDLVEVRSPGEILRTLDADGMLDSMPFMPEMVRHCGQRFLVDATADKVCDARSQSRQLPDTVFLVDPRCDGSGHDGCQARCRLLWKEAWLKPVTAHDAPAAAPADDEERRQLSVLASRNTSVQDDAGDSLYRCQATNVVIASTPLSTSDPRPYVRELTSGNVPFFRFVRLMFRVVVMQVKNRLRVLKIPPLRGDQRTSPKTEPLDLQPGEWVRVKDPERIQQTLNDQGRNRGLWFDLEMLPYCGRVFRVSARVERIIDEHTGKMLEFSNDCIALDGVACTGTYSPGRWFCRREIIPYWREAWLERADPPGVSVPAPRRPAPSSP
jgi:hypothetical protein